MLELNKIYCMDALEGLKQIEDESVDCIITDPPYGINYYSNMSNSDDYKKRVQTAEIWDKDFDISLFINEFIRITKNDGYILIFGCEENINLMKSLGCHQILVWDKNHCGMGVLSDFGIGYEFIFYFKKGSPKLRGKRVNGVLNIPYYGHFGKTLHPTQKPIKLLRYLIEKCSDENMVVFDGFMGSGTTAVACKELKRNFIGFEIDKNYCDIANKRLKQSNLTNWSF